MRLEDLLYGDFRDFIGEYTHVYYIGGNEVFEFDPIYGVSTDDLGFFDEDGNPTDLVDGKDFNILSYTVDVERKILSVELAWIK